MLIAAGVTVLAVVAAACGSSGSSSSSGSTHPTHATTSSSAPARSTTTTAPTASSTTGEVGTASGPMVTTSLPVVVCTTSTGVSTTTTSLPPSVSVSVPTSEAQQGNLAVYTDEAGRLMLVGPTVGWTCNGSFGADGSGLLALAPVGTSVPLSGLTWHLPSSSATQAIVAMESGASPVQGALLVCPFFSAAKAAAQQSGGSGCAARPPQEAVVPVSGVQVGFQDPAGVAGAGYPSGGSNAANGVALYLPKPTEASAYLATCTLPTAQHDLCTAVLHQFAATFG